MNLYDLSHFFENNENLRIENDFCRFGWHVYASHWDILSQIHEKKGTLQTCGT